MSMTLVNAKTYVARVIGGAADPNVQALAAEAIQRAYLEWETNKFWRFLQKDTTLTTAVTGVTATQSVAVVNAPTTGAFDFVNVGQTVTISAGTATLAADTTVSSYTRGSDGVITSITLSNSFGGTTNVNATLTFSANIPILQGTQEYNLPADFSAPFSARLLTTPRTLTWRDQRYWDRMIVNQATQGTPAEYTTYNPYSDLTQNYGTTHLKFDVIPSSADTLILRYYRKFNTTATTLDIPDAYLYHFLDTARRFILETKLAQDDPAAYMASVKESEQVIRADDEEPTDDADADTTMKSQYEMGSNNRPLWTNGDFDPFRY